MKLEHNIRATSTDPLIELNLAGVSMVAHRALLTHDDPENSWEDEGVHITFTDHMSDRLKRKFFTNEAEALLVATELLTLMATKSQPLVDQRINSLFLRYFKGCNWINKDRNAYLDKLCEHHMSEGD